MSGRPLNPAEQATLDRVDDLAWRAKLRCRHAAGEDVRLCLEGGDYQPIITGTIGPRGRLTLIAPPGLPSRHRPTTRAYRGEDAWRLLRGLGRTRA